jgi:hypothetical protein
MPKTFGFLGILNVIRDDDGLIDVNCSLPLSGSLREALGLYIRKSRLCMGGTAFFSVQSIDLCNDAASPSNTRTGL